MPQKFTTDDILGYTQKWDYASETYLGERLRLKGVVQGGIHTYVVTHGSRELYSGGDVQAAVAAYQSA